MLVYDVFQTEGRETPQEFLEKVLGSKPFAVKGSIHPEILDNAIETARSWGIKVSFKPLSFFNAGYVTTIFSVQLEIALKENVSHEQNFSVLIHELGYLFFGHTGHLFLRQPTKEGKL